MTNCKYTPNVIEIKETFSERTEGRTDRWTFETGFIRSALSKSRLKNKRQTSVHSNKSALPSYHPSLRLFSMGDLDPHLTHGSLDPRVFPKWHLASTYYCLDRYFWATRFLFVFVCSLFVSGPCTRLSWPSRHPLIYRIELYRIVSIHSAIFAQWLTRFPITQTDRHADHATCDVRSNRPHLCTVCRRCGLKSSNKFSSFVRSPAWK